MSNENGLMVMDQPTAIMPVMEIKQAVERRNAMVQFVKQIMVKDTDYGVIPGTGDKPTLLKAGAEKLNTFFGLAPHFELVSSVEDWTGKDHDGEPFFNYQYRCSLNRGSITAGQGEGSCNSWEKKYRYRTVFANKATDEDKAHGRLETRTSRNGKPYDVYVVTNPNPADIVNTLQKMAQKRALVAATLLAVNASEFFTQDVEDMPGFSNDVIEGEWSPAETLKDDRQNGRPPVQQRQRKPVQNNPLSMAEWRERLAKNPRPTVTTVASMMIASPDERFGNATTAVAEIMTHFPDLDGAGHQLSTEDALGIWDFMCAASEEE